MNYRLYKPEDFPALYAIETVCFVPPDRFSRSYMKQLIAQDNAATWIAEADGVMFGFGIVEWTRGEDGVVAYIQTLEVLPEARGQGAGGELLRLLEGSARASGTTTVWLHVAAENVGAIRVYESHGYAPKGTQADYYGPGRPATIYAKTLTT